MPPVSSPEGTRIVAIEVVTEARRVVATLGPAMNVNAPVSPSVRMTLSADGTSLLTTILRPKSDLWILDNFDPPLTGWRRWFGIRR